MGITRLLNGSSWRNTNMIADLWLGEVFLFFADFLLFYSVILDKG